MAKYNSVVYGQTTYGQKSRLAFSASPFTAVSLDYSTVQLNWSSPVGGYSAFRLVRNQDAFSETAEDGIILYEEYDINLDDEGGEISTGVVSISEFIDSEELSVPKLTTGKYSYYTIWLLKTADKVWYKAGQTYLLIPDAHPTYAPDGSTFKTTHQKFLDLIPRVFSSGSYSPIDEPNLNSDLSIFLKGFSFTIDEFLTELDALLPNHQELSTSPEIVKIKSNQFGLPAEGLLSLKNQKRVLRDALYIYAEKGSIGAINALAEDLTGYPVRVSVTPNLMLSVQDSTFYEGLGFWLPQGNCLLTLEDVTPVTSESLSIDTMYSAKVVASDDEATITNGTDAPVLKGVPVTAAQEYVFSLYAKMDSSTGSFTTKIKWYDFQGELLSTSTGTATSVNTTWDVFTQTATAPTGAVYAGFEIVFDAGTYYIDMVQMATSDVDYYSEARCIDVFLEPNKTNFIDNPSFESVNSAWTITGTSTVTYETDTSNVRVLAGDTVLKATSGTFSATTSTEQDKFPTGLYATLSLYGKAAATEEPIDLTLTTTTSLAVVAYSVASNVVTITVRENHPVKVGDQIVVAGVATAVNGTFTVTDVQGSTVLYSKTTSNVDTTAVTSGTLSTSVSVTETLTILDSWTRVQIRSYIPADFLTAETSLTASISGDFSDDILIDAVQLEANYSATDYFDGNYGTERDSIWAGTVDDSTSYLYSNKIVNVSRLASEIEKYIPFNTPWFIRSYSGTESSGIS